MKHIAHDKYIFEIYDGMITKNINIMSFLTWNFAMSWFMQL